MLLDIYKQNIFYSFIISPKSILYQQLIDHMFFLQTNIAAVRLITARTPHTHPTFKVN